MGVALFQRHVDGVLLTDAGHRILLAAGHMESAALAIERQLATQSGSAAGPLRISAPDWFATYVLPPAIVSLRRGFPDVVPELMVSSRLYDLSRREADIVFRMVPFEEAGIVQCRLMEVAYGLYARAGHAADALDGTGYIDVIEMDTSIHDYPEAEWLRTTLPRLRTVARTNHRGVQAALCLRGDGLAVLPRPMGDASGGLERVDVGLKPPARPVWMGYHEDMRSLPAVRALAAIAREHFGVDAAD
jgi:DNA-binding transcriptional LysR family regulator